ncbi:hypothetical protein KSP40_PGU001384 [Platanthera guangdongensis]|uniref:Uncharacterized protein n=1 Tax=Platanthera guangdongensis TaxID=2320717 RepID=A0ABR2M3R4_9ASPA
MHLFKDMMVRSGVKELPEITLSRFRKGLNPYIQGKLLCYYHTDLDTTFNMALEIEKHHLPRNKAHSCHTRKAVLGPPPPLGKPLLIGLLLGTRRMLPLRLWLY